MNRCDDHILKKFFSKNTFNELWATGDSDIFDYTVHKYVDKPHDFSYAGLVGRIYQYMSRKYRSEYYYKNTLINRLIFSKHSPSNNIALTELPISESKADFIIINRCGVVYEIKTELDNLERLKSQISDYYKAFSYVNVVTYKDNIEDIANIVPKCTGIIELTPRNALKIIRKAHKDDSRLDIVSIFSILRKQEFEDIISSSDMELPKTDQFHYYDECLKKLQEIDILDLQKKFLNELKNRRTGIEMQRSVSIQEELRYMLYFDDQVTGSGDIAEFMNHRYGG